jgi:hypothetical protein
MFERITLVNIDGRPGELWGTQLALAHSAAQMPGARCLLLSPECPKNLLPPIEHIAIAPMGHLEYSLFVTFALHNFIETDYALIVQNDGWVLNAKAFGLDFFEFDYIGAPTALADVITADGKRTYLQGYNWVQHELERAPGTKINWSMNGGFSLRSRRFLKTPSALGLDYHLRAPDVVKRKGTYRMDWPNGDAWEDVYHCVINRKAMNDAGLRFPPLSIGLRFSFEHLHHVLHQGKDLTQVFGHHDKYRRLVSLEPLTMHVHAEVLKAFRLEEHIIDAFRALGYRVEFIPHESWLY